MAFEVIPFCWIVKFSGITRFLYQFWKILPKYCGRKEKDHNILWSKWYSRREYFGLRPRADCVGTNRRALRGWSSPIEIPKARPCLCKGRAFGTPGGNTSGCALVPTASGRTAALRAAGPPLLKYQGRAPALAGARPWYSRRESNPQRPLRRGLLYPFNYGSFFRFFVCRLQASTHASRQRNYSTTFS